jgi:hypothetical protein
MADRRHKSDWTGTTPTVQRSSPVIVNSPRVPRWFSSHVSPAFSKLFTGPLQFLLLTPR